MSKRIHIVEDILSANDQIAIQNRSKFDKTGLFAINLMASPGAEKTSLILATIQAIRSEYHIAYIDGDIATSIDTDKVATLDVPAVQINTGGQCHLDAVMVQNALSKLTIEMLDLLVIENVGNLVCPTNFRLGVHRNILIASVPEGDDKPYKYPGMYQGVDAMILNKMDVLEAFDFDMDYFRCGVEILNPGLAFFALSCKTGKGINQWLEWVRAELTTYRKSGGDVFDIR